MNKNLKSFLQKIEDLARWTLVLDPITGKFKKMIVYSEEELREKETEKISTSDSVPARK